MYHGGWWYFIKTISDKVVSVVIRTRNESDNLSICLEKLSKQSIDAEIIIVDSHSTDATLEISKGYGCEIVQCKDFTFGKALNDGIKASSGKYIAILSGHCFPTHNQFLSILKGNLTEQSVTDVAGVYARQIPHKKTNPLEYRNFIYTYRKEPILQSYCPFFNNAASMIRKDIWEKIKFNESIKAQEDILWAKDVQKLGYYIAYEPKAVVEHLHNEDTFDTIKRYKKEYESLRKMELI